jgi:outer membrane biosynthesis protein TonB
MFNSIRPYTVPLIFSVCVHISVVGGLSKSFVLAPLTRESATVQFHIVDNPQTDAPEEKIESLMIDEVSAKARDLAESDGDALIPNLEGTGDEKELKTEDFSLNESSAVREPHEEMIRELVDEIENLKQRASELINEKNDLKAILEEEERRLTQNDPSPEVKSVLPSSQSLHQTEMMKHFEGYVREMGDPAFQAQADILAHYHKAIRDSIAKIWYPTMAIASPMPDSRVVIEFKVMPDGAVNDLKVLSKQGSSIFADFCITSIYSAAPFSPIPISFPVYRSQKYLTIVFPFEYN